jgi:acetyltransferase-like isoleucine patch superfamily enzyme
MTVNIINNSNVPLTDVRILGVGSVTIERGVQIRNFTVIELGAGHLTIGANSVIGYGSFLQVTGKVSIGAEALLGPHCSYISSSHELNTSRPLSKIPLIRGDINIGNNVWVCANCTINSGVNLGQGCVIGANSFVNKNIPAKQCWAGNPAKFIKNVP